jgi:protein SCO1/2
MNWQSPLLALVLVCSAQGLLADDKTGAEFERSAALEISQAAIGVKVGDYRFYNTQGQVRSVSDYAGKPLVVSLIYTSCYHICPTTTQHLATVVSKAQDALGDDSFSVVSVGFDTANDTADAMRVFARQQNVDIDGWEFLSTDAETIDALAADLGFQFFSTGSGFDHLIQSSVMDADGVVVRQVYGIRFDTPHLIEPLKALVFGEDASASLFDQLTARVKLFCTVYDPTSDRYRFDYSIFVGLVMGLVLGGGCIYLFVREWRHSRRHARQVADERADVAPERATGAFKKL